ncbi:Ppx/GppA phosphatase family protein [Saccharothrix coeruleofusca]|uniref:Ppx/GppA phosphatase family protein n=1 Tax=Saccharothrix coeruleofusca TaxID=33919 RepID=UPI0016705E96|nr:Ppx/GppA phosphatase family protein [Saccharothrix coeruleofusca]
MRLGVLDVGSNTVHLLVVDAHRGAHPTPASSDKTVLRLAEQLDGQGRLSRAGADQLVRAVAAAKAASVELECEELMAFATSAVREAANSAEVLGRVRAETGVDLRVLSGEDEARYTFLAARRWYGWSAGRLLCLDIGGGSLELATGVDEVPELAASVPLGAGRVTRTRFRADPPGRAEVRATAEWLDEQLAPVAQRFRRDGTPDRVVGTSKTFRTLARLTGAAPSSAGPRARRVLTAAGLRQLIAFISRMPSADLAELEGVSPARAPQLVAGALVAEATMRALSLGELEICPWALREGVILRRLDHTDGPDHSTPNTASERSGDTGRTGRHGARWS